VVEKPNAVPPIARYNPNYSTVDSKVKGNVLLRNPIGSNKVLEKKQRILRQFALNAKRKYSVKDGRENYLNTLIQKLNKFKKESYDQDNNMTFDKKILKKDSLLSSNSEYATNLNQPISKININSGMEMRERKKSEAILPKFHSLPQLQN
jgi:hypothetical protein